MEKLSLPVLSVKNLSAESQAGWRAVSNISFHVGMGECVAIIGPNGSGKSSLLKAITRQFSTVAGKVELSGTDICQFSRQEMAQWISIIAQHEYVDPRLTVSEYVWLGRISHACCFSQKEHEKVVRQALKDVGLSNKTERHFGELSGGEQQRASIARAFAQKAKIIFLDEPTNHLARIEILALVKAKGVTVVAVLHDLSLVSGFADKVLLLQGQKMVTFSCPEEVLNDQFMAPTFGLRVVPFQHPRLDSIVHHFEALSTNFIDQPRGGVV
jgi:iron complex transport system ATP-binding protein